MKSRGFTLIETLLALALLAAGGAVLWWSLRGGFQNDKRIKLREMAVEALISESESLQGRRQNAIHDSEYVVAVDPSASIRVRRIVLDSARRESLFPPFSMTDAVHALWRERPLEVRLEARPEIGSGANADTSQPASVLFTVLPDYLWY